MLIQSATPARAEESTGTDEAPLFLFASGQRELTATGVLHAITAPAMHGQRADSAIQQAVLSGFERARAAGQVNPVLVGAIPFATAEPSCLYIPRHAHWHTPGAVAAELAASRLPPVTARTMAPDAAGFRHAIDQAQAEFARGALSKVVLSVRRDWTFAGEVDGNVIFRRLCAMNGNDYRFKLRLGDGSTLLGASPELLLRKHGRAIVSNPLAGSMPRLHTDADDRRNARQLARSAKDQHEHQLVIGDIAARLAPLCTQLAVPARPSLSRTAALWHLSTRIEGTLQSADWNALQLACLLHPTPAVCGVPAQPAHELIRRLEPFTRGLYSGMVGWCDAAGNGEWAVTIRCGIIGQRSIRLFAGAGIVDRSDADAEWAEIQTKFGTMLRACGLDADT